MKRIVLLACLVCRIGSAGADELSDAQKLWRSRQYPQALQAFSKLAGTDNSAAQLYLGEMYGFGEGAPEDLAQSTYWLQKAAAAGQSEAAAALQRVQLRAARKADIQYYISQYDAADLRYEKFGCVKPRLDRIAKIMMDARSVTNQIQRWQECFGRFGTSLNSKSRVTDVIPGDVLELMNQDEFDRASEHILAVHAQIVDNARTLAGDIKTQSYAWLKSTHDYLIEWDKKNKTELQMYLILRDAESMQ